MFLSLYIYFFHCCCFLFIVDITCTINIMAIVIFIDLLDDSCIKKLMLCMESTLIIEFMLQLSIHITYIVLM